MICILKQCHIAGVHQAAQHPCKAICLSRTAHQFDRCKLVRPNSPINMEHQKVGVCLISGSGAGCSYHEVHAQESLHSYLMLTAVCACCSCSSMASRPCLAKSCQRLKTVCSEVALFGNRLATKHADIANKHSQYRIVTGKEAAGDLQHSYSPCEQKQICCMSLVVTGV